MLINLKKFDGIYFYKPYTDFRKGIGGLCGIVQDEMNLDPLGRFLFIFCNKLRNRIKALYWDKTGFALWYKVLEDEKFIWPSHLDSDVFTVKKSAMEEFLRGLNPWQIPHKKLEYNQV